MPQDPGKRAAETQHINIKPVDLPLSCPLPNERVWDAHPRVYLELDERGKALCPYCGTHYHLVEK